MNGRCVFKDHTLVYHSTLGLRVIKKKKVRAVLEEEGAGGARSSAHRSSAMLAAAVCAWAHCWERLAGGALVQGYLAHKKPPPRRTLQ